MTITLPPELAKFVEEKVRAGQYRDATEVVTGAVALLRQEEELTPDDLAEMQAEIATALAQLDRGEGGPWDAEQVKAKLRQRVSGSNGE
jgi:putative addiction module CopG family antidote